MRNVTIAALAAIGLLAAGPGGARATDKEPDKPPDATKPAPDSHDAVMKDMVGLLNEFAGILEKAKDKASAEKAKEDLKALGDKFQKVGARARKLGEPGKDTEEALKKKYMPEMEKAQKRLNEAAQNLAKNPEVAVILGPALQEFAKKMMEAMPRPGKKGPEKKDSP